MEITANISSVCLGGEKEIAPCRSTAGGSFNCTRAKEHSNHNILQPPRHQTTRLLLAQECVFNKLEVFSLEEGPDPAQCPVAVAVQQGAVRVLQCCGCVGMLPAVCHCLEEALAVWGLGKAIEITGLKVLPCCGAHHTQQSVLSFLPSCSKPSTAGPASSSPQVGFGAFSNSKTITAFFISTYAYIHAQKDTLIQDIWRFNAGFSLSLLTAAPEMRW